LRRPRKKCSNALGYLDARLLDITQAAKCSAGTFYTYFSSKEEVFRGGFSKSLRKTCCIPACRTSPGDDDPAAVIEASNPGPT